MLHEFSGCTWSVVSYDELLSYRFLFNCMEVCTSTILHMNSRDVIITLTKDEMALDWQAKRKEHNEYVYDSGCLTCHQELEKATQDKGMHNNYFAGLIETQCVNCHEEIGHSNLNKYLLEGKYLYGQ